MNTIDIYSSIHGGVSSPLTGGVVTSDRAQVTTDRKQDGFVTVLDKQVATSIARCADLSMAATFSTTEWFYVMVRTWKGNPRDKQCVLEIAIDSDRSTKSGYPYKLGGVGADYRWVDGRMYQYIGNGKNWMWSELFNVTQIEYGRDVIPLDSD